jgi:hypothetical protein
MSRNTPPTPGGENADVFTSLFYFRQVSAKSGELAHDSSSFGSKDENRFIPLRFRFLFPAEPWFALNGSLS